MDIKIRKHPGGTPTVGEIFSIAEGSEVLMRIDTDIVAGRRVGGREFPSIVIRQGGGSPAVGHLVIVDEISALRVLKQTAPLEVS